MHILLDTNIWRYIVDHDALGVIQQAARKSGHKIVVAPAVIYEALRTGNPGLRARMVSAMTLPCWKRLMPDAFSEAEEIKAEIIRLQPEWLRVSKDLAMYRRLRYDWKRSHGGFWDRARYDTEQESQRVAIPPLLEAARISARANREVALSCPAPNKDTKLSAVLAIPAQPTPGWDGAPVQLWRIEALLSFEQALSVPGHPYVDWLEGDINLTMMSLQRQEQARFWLYDVDPVRMPRHWLRSAFSFQQQFHKITDGTPCDCQLGTYLVDVHLMLSADKNFVRFAERCRCEAPFFVGRSGVVPGGGAAIDALLTELANPI